MESTAYANQTMPIGTAMFMAPEGYELEDGDMQPERFHPKKTDVYSFGLICFCVLIGEPTPFPPTELMNPSVKAFKGRVWSGKRPKLPLNCPNCLSGLIQQCWDGNPVNRPDFQTICTELRYIKGCLLTGMVFHHCILNIQVNSVLVAIVTCTMMPCMYWGVLGLVVRLFLPLIPACWVTFCRIISWDLP